MSKELIISKYKDRIVARDNLNNPISINRLTEEGSLKHFLYSMHGPQDESITGDGLKFLDEFYGLDYIATIVMNEKSLGVDYSFANNDEVINWLKKFSNFS